MTSKVLRLLAFLAVAIVACASIKCKASSGTGCDDPSYDKCGTNKATSEDSACPAGECIVKKVVNKYIFGCKKGHTCGGDTYCCKQDKCNTKWQKSGGKATVKPNGKDKGTGGTTKSKKSASTTTRSTAVAVLLAAAMGYLQ